MDEDRALSAVVTAGGTREPIDDVRVVANVSTGRFGAALANALADRGLRVTLVGSEELLSHPDWLRPRIEPVPFSSFRDLGRALDQVLSPAPDLLLMSAAVSDYSPVPSAGKIRSSGEELVLRLRRNPKILASLRDLCGPATYLVGFKLLSGASPEELVTAAREQVLRDRLDLSVGNDLREIREGRHPVVLVGPTGEPFSVSGAKDETARELVAFVLERVREKRAGLRPA